MVAGKKLAGSKAIVTGSAQGIGESIAKTFAREGASVLIADINLKDAERVASEIEKAGGTAWAMQADVTRSQEVKQMVKGVIERWGAIDILVNCVGGFFKFSPITGILEEEWDKAMVLNLKGTFLCSQAVAEHMMARHKGRIINIASMAGLGPNPYSHANLPYGTAKAGVIGFTKHLAKELGPYGITVNTISPSTTVTPRVAKVRDAESLKQIADQNPMKCLVEPEDSAEAALFLASEESRHVTGLNLNVNAGNVMI